MPLPQKQAGSARATVPASISAFSAVTTLPVCGSMRLAQALHIPLERMTLTQQVHDDRAVLVTEQAVGTGLHKPMDWNADAL